MVADGGICSGSCDMCGRGDSWMWSSIWRRQVVEVVADDGSVCGVGVVWSSFFFVSGCARVSWWLFFWICDCADGEDEGFCGRMLF